MARRQDRDNEHDELNRENPYDEFPEQSEYEEDFADDGFDDSVFADEEYDPYEDEDEDAGESAQGGLLGSMTGKVLAGVIALLIVVLVVLLVVRFVSAKPDDSREAGSLPAVQETQQPGTQLPQQSGDAPIVFAPVTQPTAEPTQQPTSEPTATPTAEPTSTPLPIILTNTPTPSPEPTATPEPTPTPTPEPTPTPSPTPMPVIGQGEANRDANLRESVSSNAKIKMTVKKGERVTIHDMLPDKNGKIWYYLTVDDQATKGYMRDYVVDLDEAVVLPTESPKTEATAQPSDAGEEQAGSQTTPEPTATPDPSVIGTGKTNRDANVRKVMNGKVLVQLRKNKAVNILEANLDKNGDLWYKVQPQGSSTIGYVRDYLINLDEGVKLDIPTPLPAPEATAAPEKAEEKPEEASDAAASGETAEEAPKEESVLDREVIGRAKTNREANVRTKPVSGAKLVRQLSKGNDLLILEKCADKDGNIWYEVATESGKTHGFVRDYVVTVSELDQTIEAKTYTEESVNTEEIQSSNAEPVTNSKYSYAGNKSSKVFHKLTCDSLSSSSKNLVYMESRSYAINKGYRPCENCNP